MDESYEGYRLRLFARHQNGVTNVLSTIGDGIMTGGVVAGLFSRRPRVAVLGLLSGFGVAVIAHLFQRGTLRDELRALLDHPLWAVKAERERIFGHSPRLSDVGGLCPAGSRAQG